MSANNLRTVGLIRPIALLLICGAVVAATSLSVSRVSLAQGSTGPVVTVTGGKVRGKLMAAPGGAFFKGIPYAAPPIGDLRWRETMPVKAWTTVLKADAFRPGCGPGREEGARGAARVESNAPATAVEDCLYLNVWTPQWPAATGANAGKLPVMFWIHGGELAGGSGSLGAGTESLVRHGVILVSANYRGTLIGMMGHPELTAESPHHASGNYPLLDEIAVLKWIHANIAKFGGDPNNVTVFGHSGGAHVTSMLLASPQTKGLIHKAVLHSGSPMQSVRPYLRLDEMEQIGKVTAEILKAPPTNQIKYLRSLPATDFVTLMPEVRTKLLQEHDGQAYDEGIDGYAVTQPTNEVWQLHKELPIPLMVGNDGVDSSSAPAGIGNLKNNATPEETRAWEQLLLEKFYGREPDLLQRALQIYGLKDGPNEVSTYPPYGAPALQIGVDLNHRCSVGMTVGLHSAIAPTWQFEFTRTTPGHLPTHGSELRYIFGLDNLEDAATRKQSDIMQQYWTNFAKTGDPNGAGLPTWSKYDAATRKSMEFAFEGPVLKPQPRQAACAPYVEKYMRDPKRMSSGEKLLVRGAGGAV
jgi:para-nitrobenzyl esterase